MQKSTMKAAVLKAFHQPLAVEEMPIPQPGPGEVLVKVMASGLCLTDVHIQEGIIPSVKPPYIPGHEMAGIVWKLGENVQDKGLRTGMHVICGIDITCGECALCRGGSENLCLKRVRIGFERDGSHGQYAVVPYANLHPISHEIPFDQACIIPDAVACMYRAIKHQGRVSPGDRVLFYGTGALGLQGVQIAKCLGAMVYASARTQAKLDHALAFGADRVINTREKDLVGEIMSITGGQLCDVVFDLVGDTGTIDLLLRCVRPGGKVIALAYAVDHFTVNCQELVIKEKEVLGLRGSTTRDLLDAIALVESKRIIPYVSNHFSLEQINEALDFLRASKGLGRSVIVFEPQGREEP